MPYVGQEPAEAIASSTHQTTFASSASLLSYATKSWRSDFVTTDLTTASDLDEFLKRPFFLLVGVEASASVRWSRSAALVSVCVTHDTDVGSRATVRDGLDPDSLLAFRSFLDASDALLYGGGGSSASSSSSPSGSILPSTAPTLPVEESSLSRSLSTISIDPSLSPPTRVSALPSSSSRTPLHDILALSHLRIVNNHSTLDQLSAHLALLNLADPERVRPSWDTYFMVHISVSPKCSRCSITLIRAPSQDARVPCLSEIELHEAPRRRDPRPRSKDRQHGLQRDSQRHAQLQRGRMRAVQSRGGEGRRP